MLRSSLSRFAARPLGSVPLLCAALLCLLGAARPAHALDISEDTTISTAIYDYMFVKGSPTVNVSGGTITDRLFAFDASTVNVSGGTITGDLGVVGPNARLNVFGSGLSLSEPMLNEFGQTFVLLSGTLADGTTISNRVFLVGAQVSQITLTEVDPFAALRAQVEALFADGTLNRGNTNALLVKLNAAQAALARGNEQAARGSLGAFINQVSAFVRNGKLSAEQGAPLIEGAQAILDGIG